MDITINGNVTINTTEAVTKAIQPENAKSERKPIDRTNEVLISNETSFDELVCILREKSEVIQAAEIEAEEKEYEAKEEKMRSMCGELFGYVVENGEDKLFVRPKRRPGAIQLRTYVPRIARIIIGDGVCEVFSNGYVIYDNGDRKTVLWVMDCGQTTYYFNPLRDSEAEYMLQKSEVDEKVLGSAPWYNAVIIAGENQLERNLDHPKSIGSKSDNEDEAEEWELKPEYCWHCGAHFDSPEEAYLKKEAAEERRKALTDKQREVYQLYYEEGYTQKEIAQLLDIGQNAVHYHLTSIGKRLQKNTKKFF